MRLKNKVAIITGGAGGVTGSLMGIGGATARRFAREGAKVVVTDLKDDLGCETVRQIREEGFDAVYAHLDVTSENHWRSAVAQAVETYGGLDILVQAAGMVVSRPPIEDTTTELWDQYMAVHARGTFLGVKFAAPEMRRRGGGAIVNISSIYGIVGSPVNAPYHAAKGAVRIFTKAAAVQYARQNIRVNSVHPGFTHTPMTDSAFADEEFIGARLALVPMARGGAVDEIVAGILFLASDEASYITGAELAIDGGMTAM